jgi:hypothetical protein
MRYETKPVSNGDKVAAAARRVLQKILFDNEVIIASGDTLEESTPVFHGPLAQATQRLTDEGYPAIDCFVLMQARTDVLVRAEDWTAAEINESMETHSVPSLTSDA